MQNVAAIILAAGASRRLGEPKQLVRLGGETLLERSVRVAVEANCNPVIVVLGASSAVILADSVLAPAQIIQNLAWEEGMASSIRVGLEALRPETRAVILLTCDQPAVTAEHLRSLAAEAPEEPVASAYAGRHGVPAYFPVSDFKELLQLRGDQGARRLLAAARALPLPRGEVDVDTPESLKDARAMTVEKT